MGQTRIISGVARGRKISVPPRGTRPTSDRAREGLFSSLAVLVDESPAAVETIRRNIEVVGHPRVSVVEMKASSYVASAQAGYFDMVLADPPYELSDEAVNEMVRALLPCLRDGAAVIVERHVDSPNTDWPECLVPTTQKLKKRTFGIARMDMAVFDAELYAPASGEES